MGRFWGLLLAVLLPTIAFAGGPTNPPGPIPTTCGGGNSFVAYPGYGSAPTCGTALSTGTINVGDAPQIGQYVGAASTVLGPVTISGDGALATGGALTISKIGGKAVTLGGDLTTTGIGAITLAFPATTQTFTFPTTSKTLMATDYSNASATTLGSTALTMGGTTATISGLTLVAPALGTPASGLASNLIGLPLTTGVTGILPPANGGTGISNGANTLTLGGSVSLPASPGSTQCLHMSNAGVVTTTGADCGTSSSSGTVTNSANLTNNAVVVGDGGTVGVKSLASLGTAGQLLTSNGAGSAPSFKSPWAVPLSTGWVAGVDPNNVTIAIVNQASTISAVIGDVETATGSAATVSVVSAPSGTACSAGTVLHSGTFNANGTAATNQTLTLTTTTIAAGSRLCLQTTGTTSWTGGTGIGGITVFLAPT